MSLALRTRLLLLVMSVLLPALAAATWAIWQTWSEERQEIERHLRDSTRALKMVVDQELKHRAVIAHVLSLSRMLDEAPDIDPRDMRMFDLQARRAMQGLEGWIELRSQKIELLNTRARVAAAGIESDEGSTRHKVPTLLVDDLQISALEIDPSGGGLRAMVTQPVRRDGRTLLNVSVAVLPQELQRILDHRELPADWEAAVIDSRGTLVARHPGGLKYIGKPVTAEIRQMMPAQDDALFDSLSIDGKPVTSFSSTSPQGWKFLMAIPRHSVAQHPTRAVLPVVIGALLLLMIGAVGALLVSGQIVRRVYSLKAAAAALKEGRAVPVERTGIVEFDNVADALVDASRAIESSRAELQYRVDEAIARTREAEQRSSRSQRVEALGRLTGGVAHDFNNLLGVVSNSAHLIRRYAKTNELEAPLAAILRSVEVGSRLTGHLQRFAGQQAVRPQSVSLEMALTGARELLATVLGKRIQLLVSVAADTWPVIVDAAELELALINMALNARDASAGSGRVWLQARNAEPSDCSELAAGDYVLITFSDDGSGIEEGLVERVFEPFFTTKPIGKGTGLGLSQVLGFCVQAGGIARFASTEGLGTTVSMVLPVAKSVPIDTQPLSPDADERLAGLRVLLVDDNEELRNVTASLLASFSCQVVCASDADEAVRLFDAGSPVDVVLSDVRMPGSMDGPAMGRALRQRRPRLPVVLISGYNGTEINLREFTVLRKPCAPKDLIEALRVVMEQSRESGPGASS